MQASAKEYIENLFPQFEPALQELIIEKAILKTFSAGEMLMQTGQYFRSTLLIAEGRVKLYRQGENNEEFFMYYLESGNACALSLICAAKQETSKIMAKAVDDTTVLMIPIDLMDNLMRNYKSWYYFVMETYRSRFEELLVTIDSIVFKSLDERLLFYLQKQAEQLKTKHLNITHQEIANDLNSSREVISRLLKKMELQGDLTLYRNYIEWHK